LARADRVLQYFMPNDDAEQDRMDMQNRAMFLAAGGELLYAPVKDPRTIVDLGTGTGIWAIEISEKWPNAQVTGVDLSPIQPNFVPLNVKFEVDDVEDDWTWPENHFDVIYSQFMLSGSIANIRRYFEQAFKHCRAGGYFEIHDLYTKVSSDHVPIAEDSAVQEWCVLIREGIKGFNRTLDLDFEQLAQMMRDIGFVDVVHRPFKIPIGRWPSDPVLKEAGGLQQVAMLEGVEALSLAVFTRCLRWQPEEVQVFLAKVRKDFLMRKTYTYWPW
jgi:SAM-dependent methyltransferase